MYVIYSKPNCGQCTDAKNLLEKHNQEYQYLTLNVDYTLTQFFEVAPASHKSFPLIVKDGEYFGTLFDLQKVFA